MPRMAFDFDGLIGLLARNLYAETSVFLRELVQNAHDSVLRRRAALGRPDHGSIAIACDPDHLKLSISDDGEGMNRKDLDVYLSTVGRSGTREGKASVDGMVGQFGIGFLSAFLVAGRVEVRTRRHDDPQGWLWVNTGSQEYDVQPIDKPEPGTTVTIYLRGPQDRGEILPHRVRSVVRKYADLLDVPVFVDGAGPVNRRQMPVERGAGEAEVRAWLAELFGEEPMEVIPVNSVQPHCSGALFIGRHRVFDADKRPALRVFCNRMYLREDREELLPPWATFVGGVIDTPDLTPTAARDNFRVDEQAAALRQALGDTVLRHLETLAQTAPERMTELLRYHDVGIKLACTQVDGFFPRVAHLLRWRVNDGHGLTPAWRTVGEVLANAPMGADGRTALPCFTLSDVAAQSFQMANAAGITVIDASRRLDEDLLTRYARDHADGVRLVRVDSDEDGTLFQRLSTDEAPRFARLCRLLHGQLELGLSQPVTVEVRRFQPAELPLSLRQPARSTARERAAAVLEDPTASAEMRDMAQDLLRLSGSESIRVYLNAANPLVRRLNWGEQDDGDTARVLGVLFSSAALTSRDVLAPEAGRAFLADIHRLLEHHLELSTALRALSDGEAVGRDALRMN